MREKKKKRKFPLFFGISFRVVLIIAALCLFVSYISSYIDPSKTSIPLFFGLYFVPILFINIVLFIIALASRSKSAWIPIIAMLPALLFAERFVRFGGGSAAENQANTIKIESYNVGKFVLSGNGMSASQNLDSITQHLKKENPDVVCLQEVWLRNSSIIKTVFPEYRYRTYHMFNHKGGNVSGNLIISKYEIINGGVLKFRHSTNLSLFADIVIKEDTLRIYNNHLESFAISPTSLIKSLREKRNSSEQLGNEILSVHSKMRSTVIRRSKQVSQVLSNIKKSPYPAVICGDFNDTPMSYTYHKLSYGSRDTFKEAGNGFSATYSLLWPLLRIDYVFIPHNYTGISHRTIRCNYSDHYPVVAEFTTGK